MGKESVEYHNTRFSHWIIILHNKSLHTISSKVQRNFTHLRENLDDIQTIGQLFNNLLLPKLYHTLCDDVFSGGINSSDILQFESEHTVSIKNVILDVVKHLSSSESIPDHVLELISRPTSQNGIHILNHARSSISTSCEPLLRLIHIAKYDLPLHKHNIKLLKLVQCMYMNRNKSRRVSFRILKRHTPQIMTIINNEYHNPISSAQVISFIGKTPTHLIYEIISHA